MSTKNLTFLLVVAVLSGIFVSQYEGEEGIEEGGALDQEISQLSDEAREEAADLLIAAGSRLGIQLSREEAEELSEELSDDEVLEEAIEVAEAMEEEEEGGASEQPRLIPPRDIGESSEEVAYDDSSDEVEQVEQEQVEQEQVEQQQIEEEVTEEIVEQEAVEPRFIPPRDVGEVETAEISETPEVADSSGESADAGQADRDVRVIDMSREGSQAERVSEEEESSSSSASIELPDALPDVEDKEDIQGPAPGVTEVDDVADEEQESVAQTQADTETGPDLDELIRVIEDEDDDEVLVSETGETSRSPAIEAIEQVADGDDGLGESDEGRAVAQAEEELSDVGEVFNCRTNLMVRTGPSTSYPFIGRLPCSENPKVEILDRTDNGWYKISYAGREAYVYGNYINLLDATEEVVGGLDELHRFAPEYNVRDCSPFGMGDCEEDELEEQEAPKRRPSTIDDGLGDFKLGCEVLVDVEQNDWDHSSSEQYDQFSQCLHSIRVAITADGRNMSRGQVFRKMYTELRPEEQHFAAMVFTAQGEADIITRGETLEEMLAIMKVIDNRVDRANTRAGEDRFNQLDIVLDPQQFSMYNPNERNWRDRINPNYPLRNFRNAIRSYMEYPNSNFEPMPEMDHVYHYHANYVRPSWAVSARNYEFQPVINGRSTRDAPSGFNENSRADMRRIGQRYSRVRHRFYTRVDNRNMERGWVGAVSTPWR